MKINCSGKILIARYGKIFRGNKVKNNLFFFSTKIKSYIVSYMGRTTSLKLLEDCDLLILCTSPPNREDTFSSLYTGVLNWVI